MPYRRPLATRSSDLEAVSADDETTAFRRHGSIDERGLTPRPAANPLNAIAPPLARHVGEQVQVMNVWKPTLSVWSELWRNDTVASAICLGHVRRVFGQIEIVAAGFCDVVKLASTYT